MPDQLGDLLGASKFAEPPEIKQIKDFVNNAVGITPRVAITTGAYIVHLPSAAAAGVLRTHIPALKKILETQKRIIIRIG